MAKMLREVKHLYHLLNVEWADPRVSDFLGLSSPIYMVVIIASYAYFVKSLGPRLMENRKPMNVDRVVQIYNLIQIILNIYIFYKALVLGWATDYSWRCQPVDYSLDPKAVTIARTTHMFFLLKCSDLFDTVFFILKKKESHVSFLHVYHHAGMVFGAWIATKYFPGGHVTLLGLVNSFVHVVMYSYYLVTSLHPQYRRNVWWKKYITQLQMAQFLLIGIHSSQLFFNNSCNFPLIMPLLLVPQNIFMFFLFLDFYRKTYLKSNKK